MKFSWINFNCQYVLLWRNLSCNEKLKHGFYRDIFIITRSPEQYRKYFNTEEEVRKKGEFDGGFRVFDDNLDSNQK